MYIASMKILFLDQSGKLGGAELNLLDLAKFYRDSCLVCLFADGSFKEVLEQNQVPVRILSKRSLEIYKDSNFWQSIKNIGQLIPLVSEVAQVSKDYDLIYANTQKAMVVGAVVSCLTAKPLIYHLHDILSLEHFSKVNCQLAVLLANCFAALIIANSEATKNAFIQAGGSKKLVETVYNGFDLAQYQIQYFSSQLKQKLNLNEQYIVGHFSRLSPWKGQHILIEALTHCPEVTAILVGDALFGEDQYVDRLHQQVKRLKLSDRVHFLGFRTDIPELMSICDLVVHTSTAPEPLGRVIVEAMLCGKPIIASAAGGAVELIEDAQTGWLTPPKDVLKLAETINYCRQHPKTTAEIAQAGKISAIQRFNLSKIQQQIDNLLSQVIKL
jgi:glycosyltransferase involved in cell wall biosynthesis